MSMIETTRRRGFTLVELLVVIGIIALLVSILIPALNAARRSANSVVCCSHLRSIANAFEFYANDNHDMYPWAQLNYTPIGGGDQCVITWDDLIGKYIDSHLTDAETKAAYLQRPLPVLACPSDDIVRTGYVVNTHGLPVYTRSYGVPCAPDVIDAHVEFEGIGGACAVSEPINWNGLQGKLCVKRAWIPVPTQMILAFDMASKSNSLGGFFAYAAHPYEQTVAYTGADNLGTRSPHGKKWNYAFCDGHVESLDPLDTVRWAGSVYNSYDSTCYMWTRNKSD